LASALLRNELSARGSSQDKGEKAVALSEADWTELRSAASFFPSDGRDSVVVFVDLECPYCAKLDREIRHLASVSPTLSVGIAHYPLRELHRFAQPGAIASECAREQGRFHDFVSKVLAGQDSIGLLSWSEFASRSGVRDINAFAACSRRSEAAMVKRGEEVGRRLGLIGTPAIAFGGKLYKVPPPLDSLSQWLSMQAQHVGPLRRQP
jgi:protein-disulfide isomerase